MSREQIAAEVGRLGREINALRETLLNEGFIYCAGMVRTGEEGLLFVHTALRDASVSEDCL